jgi:hypothetical protein
VEKKRPGHEANYIHVAPKSRMSGAVPLLPLYSFVAQIETTFRFLVSEFYVRHWFMFPTVCVEFLPDVGFSAQLLQYPQLAGSIIKVWFTFTLLYVWGGGRGACYWSARSQRLSFPSRSSGTDISARIVSLLTQQHPLMFCWPALWYIGTIATKRMHYLLSINFCN